MGLSTVATSVTAVLVMAMPLVAAAITSAGRRGIARKVSEPQPARAAKGRDEATFDQSAAGRLLALYFNKSLVSAAMAEAAALSALVAYAMDRNAWLLALAALLAGVIIAHFPTVDAVERWIDQQLRTMKGDGGRLR